MKKCSQFYSFLLVLSVSHAVYAAQENPIAQLEAIDACVETVYTAAQDIANTGHTLEKQVVDLVNDKKVQEAFTTIKKYNIPEAQVYAKARLIAQQDGDAEVDALLEEAQGAEEQTWFERHPILITLITAGGVVSGVYLGKCAWDWWKARDAAANTTPPANSNATSGTNDTSGTDGDSDSSNPTGDNGTNYGSTDLDLSDAEEEPTASTDAQSTELVADNAEDAPTDTSTTEGAAEEPAASTDAQSTELVADNAEDAPTDTSTEGAVEEPAASADDAQSTEVVADNAEDAPATDTLTTEGAAEEPAASADDAQSTEVATDDVESTANTDATAEGTTEGSAVLGADEAQRSADVTDDSSTPDLQPVADELAAEDTSSTSNEPVTEVEVVAEEPAASIEDVQSTDATAEGVTGDQSSADVTDYSSMPDPQLVVDEQIAEGVLSTSEVDDEVIDETGEVSSGINFS